MESSSEGDDKKYNTPKNGDNIDTVENQGKPKRKMKTPFQLEILEKAYAAEPYPTETERVELSEKLGLTDRQLQMWFCHRRLKDKKGSAAKKCPLMNVEMGSVSERDKNKMEIVSDPGSGSRSGPDVREPHKMGFRYDVPVMQRPHESLESIMELRAIAAVEEQLGEPVRDDGPILGMEFDSLPPDAFGAPIAMAPLKVPEPYESTSHEQIGPRESKAFVREKRERPYFDDQSGNQFEAYGRLASNLLYDSRIEGLSAKTLSSTHNAQFSNGYSVVGVHPPSQQYNHGHALLTPAKDMVNFLPREPYLHIRREDQSNDLTVLGAEHSSARVPLDVQNIYNVDAMRIEKKRKVPCQNDDVKISKEVEVHEKRIRKELDKQDIMRRKMEEQMRKEMEKQDRERRKEEERLMREKQREEERLVREHRREIERREKVMQKESLKAEKRRQKEELRREKEMVRQKVATERASARKIARESMELIEDERLEMMEMAASSKGLPSIISLDHDTIKNIDSFRDSLITFPPMSVQVKKPFGVQPWIDSDANVGNLLMVWRFLINFVDVLELWPFTLDEFVQAFHDFDSRLLSEIHVALLKLIIKDIEDVARTPSTGSGMNPIGGVNPEGGHSSIVEGAYMWGFSIRSWQRHLNPLTWPEILRQMAISAGYGPRLKNKSFKWGYLENSIEKKGVEGTEAIVSTLRNGSAAEIAVAKMQERGFTLPRKPRHRLTPGTVKFAAFHVLSLEGNKGLTILDLASKIQKFGLRDLTTSKTPEASIGVALSRDTKLFERIAPSTYRVRTPFRKDPEDADLILSGAREKLQVFANGFLAREDGDVVEKDEDSECDAAEGTEFDILSTPSDMNKGIIYFDEESTLRDVTKDSSCNNEIQNGSSSLFASTGRDVNNSNSAIDQYVSGHEIDARISEEENIEIDESKTAELWVEGLAKGEYFDLSVEERLNALVTLVGFANDGNTIRVALEERLEAANTLRKQMWAEAQLDKRRLKEEFTTKFIHPSEGFQNPLPYVETKENENKKVFIDSPNSHSHLDGLPTAQTLVIQDFSTGADNVISEQNKLAAERSRAQLKSYISHIAEEMHVYRSLPLGQDRRRNRYWQFVASASKNDLGSGRIFIELCDGQWRLIDTEEAFDALVMSLETRGIRESHLNLMLKKIETTFKENARTRLQGSYTVSQINLLKNEFAPSDDSPDCTASVSKSTGVVCGLKLDTSEPSSSFRIELGSFGSEKAAALIKYHDFEKWAWNECFNSLTLCGIKYGKERCTPLFGSCELCLNSYILEDSSFCSCLGFSNDSYLSSPIGFRLLKAILGLIEVNVPLEALHSFWTEEKRKIWGTKLHASSSIVDVLKILTMLEVSIKRDFLSSNFETTQELLRSGNVTTVYDSLESVPELPWIPQTSAAVALRLLDIDASIVYAQDLKAEPCEDNPVLKFVNLASRSDFVSEKEVSITEMDHNNIFIENSADPSNGRKSSRCGRGRGGRPRGRTHGERWQTRVSTSFKSKASNKTYKDDRNHNNTKNTLEKEHVSGWGRRIIRGTRTEKIVNKETSYDDHFNSAISPIREEIQRYANTDNVGEFRLNEDDSDCAEAIGYDDNVHESLSEPGNWSLNFQGSLSDEEMDGSQYEDGNSDADVGLNEDFDGMLNRTADEDWDEDQGFESEFSDEDSD